MNRVVRNSYLSLVYLFLYVPIIVVICFSFNNSAHSLLWRGFTWHWYYQLFHDTSLGLIALHSLVLGISAASIATLFGMWVAIVLYRYQFSGKRIFYLLIFTLIVLPDLVMGIAFLLLFSLSHFPLGFWSLFIAHTALCFPFACVNIFTRLRGLDANLIEAGRDLGAHEWQLYQHILIPLLWPSLMVSWLLCFTLSLDDVVISYFVSGPSFQILPLKIFAMVKLGANPEINALSSLILVVTFTFVIGSQLLTRKKR